MKTTRFPLPLSPLDALTQQLFAQLSLSLCPGLLQDMPTWLAETFQGSVTRRLLIISEPQGWEACAGSALQEACNALGIDTTVCLLPSGEAAKTQTHLECIYQAASDAGLTRSDALLALGGGCITDVAGFAASTYMRGTRFISCPTTLLAQVDASVGGKVGINWHGRKNHIGSFYPAHAVGIDPLALLSLPPAVWQAGWAEIIKMAAIEASIIAAYTHHQTFADAALDPKHAWPKTLWMMLQECLASGTEMTHPTLDSLAQLLPCLTRAIALKAMVVAIDPTETRGERMLLNLGHTFAHAIETETRDPDSGEEVIPHGQAVSVGLMMAFQLAQSLGRVPASDVERLNAMLAAFQLPTTLYEALPQYPWSITSLVKHCQHDKKNAENNTIRFILPTLSSANAQVGEASPCRLSPQAVIEALTPLA